MKLLNTKSILDCDEYESEVHNQEIDRILDKIFILDNYHCVIIFKYVDKAHEDIEDVMKECLLHDFMEMIEYTDFKNGIDFTIDENGVLIIVVYGQGYEYNEQNYLVETHIHVMPYGKDRKFLKITDI